MKDIGILFDLDGTLLDTLEDLTDATNQVLTQFGYPRRSREEVRRFVGNGARNWVQWSVPQDTDPARTEQVFQAFQEYYSTHCQEKTRPYGGIPEALEALRQAGYPMAIVSNKPDGAVKSLCRQYFPGLYARGETPDCPRKPDPAMVRAAAREIGVAAERCIYVGDSEVDVETGFRAGMPVVSVTWGFRPAEVIRAAGGEIFCHSPGALTDAVKEVEKRAYGI